ncbi:hypothetical protein PIB30_106793 [Stylosanthes scabra]|uniref:Uncharacterized protein n=1 Tax=Stylosanthes scabra TaxID=79078 RepID=A0ABU6ZY18_9FABA|nr:hypothetical protein [Stylosanthes scabra]
MEIEESGRRGLGSFVHRRWSLPSPTSRLIVAAVGRFDVVCHREGGARREREWLEEREDRNGGWCRCELLRRHRRP